MENLSRLLTASIALAILSVFSGCAMTGSTVTTDKAYAAVSPQSVQILFEKPDRAYQVIGQVTSDASIYMSRNGVIQSLRTEAAKLGAQAIIVGGIKDTSTWQSSYQAASALAIRWK